MNYDIDKRLKQIKVEDYIWIIYLFIIFFSFYGNYLEKNFFLNNDLQSKEKYQKINAIIFSILIIIYAYFEKEAINSYKEKNKSKKKQNYDKLILVASSAILISGFIFLYIILDDTDLEEEIAFN